MASSQLEKLREQPPWIYILIVIVVTAIVYNRWQAAIQRRKEEQFARERGCSPPGQWVATWPLGLDFLYHAFRHGLDQTVMEWFAEMAELSGVTHEQRLLGNRNIGTMDPKILQAVLKDQFEDFNLGFRIPQFRDLAGSSVFTQEGKEWRHSRNLLKPLFSSNRLYGFDDIQRCVEKMLEDIKPGEVVDMYPRIFRLTLDTSLFMLFGDTAASMETGADVKRREEFGDAINLAQEYLAYRTRVGPFHWLINGPAMWRACKIVHTYVDAAIKESLEATDKAEGQKSEKPRYVFIDELIKQTRDLQVLRDQSLSLMIGGRDSTGACLTWTVRMIALHPEVLRKLREEVASVVGLGSDARQPTRDDLKQMIYLNHTINESLRLYPPVPVNQRAASRMTTLPTGGGPDGKSPIMIREGESVGYLIYGMHRRKDIFGEDAKKFVPERWENDAQKRFGYGFLPFGAGPRACLGQEFARTETAYTVARMIQWFPYWTVPEGETTELGTEKQLLTIVVSCAEGVRIILNKEEPT